MWMWMWMWMRKRAREKTTKRARMKRSTTRRDERAKTAIGADNSPAGQLLELIFQLSVAFSMEQFINGQPSSSLLVYLSGILGFSAENFLPAKNYTPHLSGLIYVQRVHFLEHALPFRTYPYLGIPRRPRLRQFERLDVIRRRYMTTGSQSPLEEFQSLRDFGRVIALTDPPSFLLY